MNFIKEILFLVIKFGSKRQELFYTIQSLKGVGRTSEQIFIYIERKGFKSMVEYVVVKHFNNSI